MNFLKETLVAMEDAGYCIAQITFIGSANHVYEIPSWSAFQKLADFDYDNGYGGQRIAIDLVIEFDDGGWLTRGEYDGSEWWEMNQKQPPILNPHPVFRLMDETESWVCLGELNPPYEDNILETKEPNQ